jgi:hypothetical protein
VSQAKAFGLLGAPGARSWQNHITQETSNDLSLRAAFGLPWSEAALHVDLESIFQLARLGLLGQQLTGPVRSGSRSFASGGGRSALGAASPTRAGFHERLLLSPSRAMDLPSYNPLLATLPQPSIDLIRL